MDEKLLPAVIVFLNHNPKLLSYLEAASKKSTSEMMKDLSYLKKLGDIIVPETVDLLKASLSVNDQLNDIISLLKTGISSHKPNPEQKEKPVVHLDMDLLEIEDPELFKDISNQPWLSCPKLVKRFNNWLNKPRPQ